MFVAVFEYISITEMCRCTLVRVIPEGHFPLPSSVSLSETLWEIGDASYRVMHTQALALLDKWPSLAVGT